MKEISTSLVFSAIALLLMAASQLLLSHFLLQPVHAQTPMTFKTPHPAFGEAGGDRALLTFDAQGTLTPNYSGYQPMNGTFQINSTSDGSIINSGDFERGRLSNNSQGVVSIDMISHDNDVISTSCSTSSTNIIQVNGVVLFKGAVNCDTGGDTTAQPSSSPLPPMSRATTQDRDGDGIPDANDNCPNLPNTRCYKVEDTTRI